MAPRTSPPIAPSFCAIPTPACPLSPLERLAALAIATLEDDDVLDIPIDVDATDEQDVPRPGP